MLTYLDFDVLLERAETEYRARVLTSPAGQAMARFALPFSEMELENFLLRIGRPRRGTRRIESPEMAAAKTFGGRLFEAVFGDAVRACLHSSLDEAGRQGAGLRIRLRLADAPELADLPWEYLYNPALNRFLSLSADTPIVRYLDLPERIRPLAVQPPLRVLVMISNPSDYLPLDVDREWALLGEALGDLMQRGLVVLERLEEATLAALQRRLRNIKKEYHIFHFVGHGGFDEQAQDGVLLLEDEAKRGRPVSGQHLGALLHDERTLRLTILNACEGARASRSDPFAGTAQSLVQQGIPAVIAMQFEITDAAAITLAHEFYAVLADGYPVDAALVEARKAIFAKGNDVEWGTPVLHLRAPDGRIFDVKRMSDSATAIGGERPTASLIVRRGAEVGRTYALRADSTVIGRVEGATLVIEDSQISRSHAKISWVAGQYVIQDLNSTNGTLVNGVRITAPQPLANGDSIGVGQTLLAFQVTAPGAPAPGQTGRPRTKPTLLPTRQAKFTHDVFVNYSHADREWVQSALLPRLEATGLRIIIDYRDFEIGVPRLVNMERAMDNSRHTLIVLTPAWVENAWVELESLLVGTPDPTGRMRKLLPLLLIPCQLPPRIATLTYADFTQSDDRANQFIRLLRQFQSTVPMVEPAVEELPAFVVGPPITHPRYFFGRERELKRLFNLWQRPPLQNAAIIGPRRSGKTSLLLYLKSITTTPPEQLRPGQRADWLPQPERTRWIYVDFQDPRQGSREELLRYLRTGLLLPELTPLDVVSGSLRTPTVILLDGIGIALQRYPELDNSFWEGLRTLAANQVEGNLAFVLVARKSPDELAHHSGLGSHFFNIFGYTTTLGPLTEPEARELIAGSPTPFPPADIDWILAQSERWPILLQILCRERLVALENGESGDAWRAEGLRQMEPFSHLLDIG